MLSLKATSSKNTMCYSGQYFTYEDFLTNLVCNLLDEGNTLFEEREWDQAVKEFSEGLNVSEYAAAEEIHIPEALLESLYVNRATAYYTMGEYDQGVADCDEALEVCKESYRALYRKALCLKELGKHKEAYNCTTECLLINRLDKPVNDLAQELAVHLGLKNRKPYVSAKKDFSLKRVVTNGDTAAEAHKVPNDHVENNTNPLTGIVPGSVPRMPQSLILSRAKSCQPSGVSTVPDSMMDSLDDCELMGDDLDSLLDSFPNEPEPCQTPLHAAFSVPILTSPRKATAPSVLPAPTPQLPPAFFNSPVSQLNSLDIFLDSGGGTSTLDVLDDLSTTHGLDALDDFPSGVRGSTDSPNRLTPTLDDLDDLLDTIPNTTETPKSTTELDPKREYHVDSLETFPNLRPQSGDVSKTSVNTVNYLDSLDSLDSFSSVEGAALSAISAVDSVNDFPLAGIIESHRVAAPIMQSPKSKYKERNNQAPATVCNPLSSTHEFMQACSACFPRQGEGIYTFVHKPDLVHNCKRDILLCRYKASFSSAWTRVRPIPNCPAFAGPFVLCKELQKSGDKGLCKYGEMCTFAFNPLEIDVWTLERKGLLDRRLLFEPSSAKQDPINSIIRLLKDHKGMFIFLCQACYDGKPTIISKRSKDNHTICSNTNARHIFDANKCLAFVIKTPSVRYRKVRPLSVLCCLDLCHHNIRYGCLKENNCQFAHSDIELKTWRVQRDTGIKPDEIVKVSTDYYEKQEQSQSKQKGSKMSVGGGRSKARGGGAETSLDMRMRFACSLCWPGRISEPDKALKYCTAKAKHTWTKDRRVLLVLSLERSKWVMVRPLPHSKNFPVQYDICTQILDKGKCNYIGNCTFAHSQEEKKMWMYMKNNDLLDMQQIYDMWLSLSAQNRQTNGSVLTQSVPEEKFIVMPTDYAEPMSGFHCELCGKHSNSERQWQKHISTEKHKDRVFSCEGQDESLTWNYRFPAKNFELCPKLNGDCPDGVCCDYAHSPEELQEWIERRDLLRHKLAKARKDMLIMPHESDFGKYNFLLQD
ncbi:zinc finger CCCH domain-containing protein 7B-like isoform X2 [Sphaeramia orbicularis]|uniref:zinc finger CCCH domain-containing protein 7B-like isoform X2 n=1 Tax=Sphaeramia orbicularis TaxID=375764 RepID=UPI00117EF53D|nr:zinc finger CCCH domain-containing protein 7B-like isoform X2 [Sphaeramia orbicularis]XP_029997618.1 zinc finger CCCH domain-containing protein 7B-like isoform X2 [Sphaeramia orbicularis]